MYVKLWGIVIDCRDVQPSNVDSSIFVIPSGIFKDVNDEQP